MIHFFADGPSKAADWQVHADDYRKMARGYRRLAWGWWISPVIAVALLVPTLASGKLGMLALVAAVAVLYVALAVRGSRDCRAAAVKMDAKAVECQSVAADLRLGLWPALWQADIDRAYARALEQP